MSFLKKKRYIKITFFAKKSSKRAKKRAKKIKNINKNHQKSNHSLDQK